VFDTADDNKTSNKHVEAVIGVISATRLLLLAIASVVFITGSARAFGSVLPTQKDVSTVSVTSDDDETSPY